MEESTRHKNPLDRALDLLLYAPVGFVAEAPSLLPRFVKRGRDQVAVVRALGVYAVRRDSDQLHDVVEQHPATRSTLQALGLVPAREDGPRRNGTGSDAASELSAISPADEGASILHEVPTPEPAPEQPREPAVDPASLAIPDYESLSASQVVPRLESLTTEELEAIRQYENGNRARRTILNKIAQLQAS